MRTWWGGPVRGTDLPDPEQAPDEVRARADDVLSSSKYDYSDRSFMDGVREWIEDVLDWLFDGFEGPDAGDAGGGGGWFGWLAWLVIVVGLVVLVVYIGRVVASGRLRTGGRRKQRDEVVVEEITTRTSDQWLAEADRHEAAGRWREGILCRYRALVVELGDREVLQEVAGLTAGELRRDMTRHAPSVAGAFGAATDLFEDVWYGGVTAGPEERDRFATLSGRTVDAVTTAVASAVPAGVPGAEAGR